MADAFENILGQPQVRDFLRSSVRNRRVTHAYLFIGPTGSNKTLAAYALAQAILCPKGPDGPRGGECGACNACRKIMRKKHPDVRYYAPAGVNGYLVDQVREIIADVSYAPVQADKKVYILDRVDLLGAASANALLKTLEEPPEGVVLILLGRTRESVLPTILSRCQVVPFRHIPASEAAGIVCQNTGAPIEQARMAIEACSGSITGAIEFLRAADNKGLAHRAFVLEVMASLAFADDWDVIKYSERLVKDSKGPLDDVIAEQEQELAENADFLQKSAIRQIEARNKRQIGAKTGEFLRRTTAIMGSWLRDVMVTCAGAPDLVINVDVRSSIEAASRCTSEERLSEGLRAIRRADEALAYNVSPQTCFDALLFEMREVLHGSGSTD